VRWLRTFARRAFCKSKRRGQPAATALVENVVDQIALNVLVVKKGVVEGRS